MRCYNRTLKETKQNEGITSKEARELTNKYSFAKNCGLKGCYISSNNTYLILTLFNDYGEGSQNAHRLENMILKEYPNAEIQIHDWLEDEDVYMILPIKQTIAESIKQHKRKSQINEYFGGAFVKELKRIQQSGKPLPFYDAVSIESFVDSHWQRMGLNNAVDRTDVYQNDNGMEIVLRGKLSKDISKDKANMEKDARDMVGKFMQLGILPEDTKYSIIILERDNYGKSVDADICIGEDSQDFPKKEYDESYRRHRYYR